MYTKELLLDDYLIVKSEIDFKENIDDVLISLLDKIGVYYRCFSRFKSADSIYQKLERKKDIYVEGKRMQDIYGVRIVLYYNDDIDIVLEKLKDKFKMIELVRDKSEAEVFRPERLNVVMDMPVELKQVLPSAFFEKYPIDKSFEIQLRTVLSEGWHEVEHDMRYKCLESWKRYDEYSRVLNGIFATLNTCDWAIIDLFDDMAYKNYKNKEWVSLLRNKFRIKIVDPVLDEKIQKILDDDHKLAKEIYRCDRKELIELFYCSKTRIKLSADNVVKMINAKKKINKELLEMTSQVMLSYDI